MPRVSFTTNFGSVIKGVRVRRERVYVEVNAAADRIAEITNDELIPEFYPGSVQSALHAVAEPAREGARLSAIRVRRMGRGAIFNFYEFGVKPHPIPKTGRTFMAFYWEKIGAWKYTYHVNHPGYEGRHKLPELKEAVAGVARSEWLLALERAMGPV